MSWVSLTQTQNELRGSPARKKLQQKPHDLWVHRPRPMTLSLCNFTPEGSSQSNTVLTQIAQYCLEMEKASLPVRLEVFVGTTPKSSVSERSVELLSVNSTVSVQRCRMEPRHSMSLTDATYCSSDFEIMFSITGNKLKLHSRKLQAWLLLQKKKKGILLRLSPSSVSPKH